MREYWTPEELRNAARLLTDAAANLHTDYPHSYRYPNPTTLSAVRAMIEGALGCIKQAQPSDLT